MEVGEKIETWGEKKVEIFEFFGKDFPFNTNRPMSKGEGIMSLNQVTQQGNLCRDPRYNEHASDPTKNRAWFVLAVNRDFASEDTAQKADFIPCVCWGKQADAVAKYLSQGDEATVTGQLRSRTIEVEGQDPRREMEVRAGRVQFGRKAKKKDGTAELSAEQLAAITAATVAAMATAANSNETPETSDDCADDCLDDCPS